MGSRWRRYFVIALLGSVIVGFAGCRLGIPDRIARSIIRGRFQSFPEGQPFSSLPVARQAQDKAASFLKPSDLLVTTAVWPAHIAFTRKEWLAMSPVEIPPLTDTHFPDGTRRLRNPKAERAGMLGIFGLHLPWSKAREVDVAGVSLQNVGARFKGNGTFIEAMRSYKRSFKLDFNDHVPGQKLAGLTKLNLNNLSQDISFLNEALAAEYYRDVGVLASRTAFADVSLTIDSEGARRRLGLYLLVENADSNWLKERFGTKDGALWKPVTPELFVDRGTNWSAYEGDYQPQTELSESHRQRVMQFANLVSHASAEEFASKLGDFVDLENLSRFLAAEVLTSNYDSFIGLGQNYLLYLDPETKRFGFAPWDLDHGWGEFFLVGSQRDKEQASIWHPWIGRNRFLERVLSVPEFREQYRKELERQLATYFVPARLSARIDELATLIRPYLSEESERRLKRFEWATGSSSEERGYSLKRFIEIRERSVRDQLSGKAAGRTPKRRAFF